MKARSICILICAAVVFAAVETWASGPISVYAIVDKVVFEPNEANPERVQIWGVFSRLTECCSKYSAVQRGYLYYEFDRSRPSATQATRAIWADLKAVAGTGEAIGFGGSFLPSEVGKLRKTTDKPKGPDVFPLGNPVTRLGSSRADVVAKLKAALQAR